MRFVMMLGVVMSTRSNSWKAPPARMPVTAPSSVTTFSTGVSRWMRPPASRMWSARAK